MSISFFWKHAGLISIWKDDKYSWAFHLFPERTFWIWGCRDSWYDGPMKDCGFGPLFLYSRYEK